MVDSGQLQLLVAILFSGGFALIAFGARVLDAWGSLLAFGLAILIVQAVGFVWLFLLIVFVAVGFLVTKLFWARKEALGVAEGKTGTRGWRNVAANGGVPAIIASMTWLGARQEDVALGFIAAIATASADTFASELGVLSSRVYLITKPWVRVPAGTNGGVSNWGHGVALLGAAVASAAGMFLLDVPVERAWIPVAAGWIGCQFDSVLGALFEEERGRAYGFLSKADVNFIAIALAAFGVLLVVSV
jgi:uncharacterized protein (TIGR00297 family)